jgi:hypothetical protein
MEHMWHITFLSLHAAFKFFHVCICNRFENTIISFLITQIINNRPVHSNLVSKNNAVDTATSYWMDDRGVGVRVPVGS